MFSRLKLLCALLLCPTLLVAAPVDQERLYNAPGEGDNWLSHGRDWQETRFSPLQLINTENVSELNLAWYVDLPDTRGLEATPLVADGVMYTTGNWSVVRAYDAGDGTLLWEYDPGVNRNRAVIFCCGIVNRGVALWQDLVILGTLDGYLVALDRDTGAERWRSLTVDPDKPFSITGAPRVMDGVAVIGNGGSEYGVRGYVSGYSAATGEQLWRFYTVPGNPDDGFESPQMEQAAATWTGEWWTMGGGGTVWDSLAYDPELDLLYVGVGNGGPHNQLIRSPGGGDNLFLASVVALRPKTGEYVWHHQQNPGETWDFTATQQMVLADIEWRGQPRKVLMQAPKNGFFFIYDRATGELLSAEPIVPVNWASHYDLATGRPVENPAARYKEAPFTVKPPGVGAHNWHSMSWSPTTGLMYIPTQVLGFPFEHDPDFVWHDNHWNLGYKSHRSPFGSLLTEALLEQSLQSHLLAWDPVAQREVWRAATPRIGNGGTLATAGNLVFQGQVDQRFRAYDARDGGLLWDFYAQHGIVAAPISYAVTGEQYVAVLAGRGGGLSQTMGLRGENENPQRRLLAFKLGGETQLPAFELPVDRRQQPPEFEADAGSIERGAELYRRFCLKCHGAGLRSDDSIPDLRRLDNHWYEQFSDVVLNGTMRGLGMPGFDDVLDEDDVTDLKAYVLDEAHEDWAHHQSGAWWMAIKLWWADLLATVLLWFSQ